MNTKETIKKALDSSNSGDKYMELFNSHVENGSSSGPNQSEAYVHYTKLNLSRSKRVKKTFQLLGSLEKTIKEIQSPQTWLIITETWCGDAANSVPVLEEIAKLSPFINTHYVLRDEHTDLMDQFLTKGGRSIPKLIILDGDLNVLGDWGPRPKPAQKMYQDWRANPNQTAYDVIQVELQKWYNSDKGQTLQKELLKIFEQLKSGVKVG